MTNPFPLAVLGAGRVGMAHARNATGSIPAATLACVVEADPAVGDRAGAGCGVPVFAGLKRALSGTEFDGVVITAPTFVHAELAVLAAGAGKHIFCEKPMALTLQECDSMALAASERGSRSRSGSCDASSRSSERPGADRGRRRRHADGGQVPHPRAGAAAPVGTGSAPLERDARRGEQPRFRLRALARRFRDRARRRGDGEFQGRRPGVTAPNFYDNVVVSLRFAGGAIGTIDGTCPADYGYDARAEALGTDGLLVVGDNRSMPLFEIRSRASGRPPPSPPGRSASSTPTARSSPRSSGRR